MVLIAEWYLYSQYSHIHSPWPADHPVLPPQVLRKKCHSYVTVIMYQVWYIYFLHCFFFIWCSLQNGMTQRNLIINLWLVFLLAIVVIVYSAFYILYPRPTPTILKQKRYTRCRDLKDDSVMYALVNWVS